MTPGPRRIPLRKILGFIVAAVLLLALAGWLWLRSVESRRWARMTQRVAELRRENDARCGHRPVFHGDPLPGDAWDNYRAACDLLKDVKDMSFIWKFVSRDPAEDRTKVVAAIRQWSPALDLFQKGARRASARRVRLHEAEVAHELSGDSPMGLALRLSALAACRARLLTEEGKSREAADLLLDVCQLGQDICRDGTVIACYMGLLTQQRGIVAMKDILCEGNLSPADLALLDRQLIQVETSFPLRGPAVLGDLEVFGERLLNDRLFSHYFGNNPANNPPPVGLLDEFRPGWRYGFSTRLLMTSAFDRAEGWARRLENQGSGAPVDDTNRWFVVTREATASRNGYAELFLSGLSDGEQWHREHLTQLRLLRTAVHYYATGEIVDLPDPFGTTLRHLEHERTLKLWGLGLNGKDDGGEGEWTPATREDIVLEIPKRGHP